MPSSRQDNTVLSCLVGVCGVATNRDCRRQEISKLNMFSFLQFCPVSKCGVNWVFLVSTQFPICNYTCMIWCREWIANHDRQGAYHNLVRELHSDSVGFSNYLSMRKVYTRSVRRLFEQDPATDQPMQHQLSHVHQWWTANCDVIFGNWVRTCLQTRSQRRRDSTKLFTLNWLSRTTDKRSSGDEIPECDVRYNNNVCLFRTYWTINSMAHPIPVHSPNATHICYIQ